MSELHIVKFVGRVWLEIVATIETLATFRRFAVMPVQSSFPACSVSYLCTALWQLKFGANSRPNPVPGRTTAETGQAPREILDKEIF